MARPHFCPRCPSSPLVADPFGGADLVCPLCQHAEPAPAANDWWGSGPTAPPAAPPVEPLATPAPQARRSLVAGLLALGLICFAIPVLVLALGNDRPKENPPPTVAVVSPPSHPRPVEPPSAPVEQPRLAVVPERLTVAPVETNPTVRLPDLPTVPERPPLVGKQPDPPTAVEPRPERKVVGRLQRYSEEELRRGLDDVPEIGLERVAGSTKFMVERAKALSQRNLPFNGPLANLPSGRTDLVGLPMRMGKDCHLGKEEAENLHALSRKLRGAFEQAMMDQPGGRAFRVLPGAPPADPRIDSDRLDAILGGGKDWTSADAIPTMLQMMQAENKPVRKVLVERLAAIPDRRATAALAMRAVTDLSPDLREAALKALKDRSAEDYRPILLAGLRYPFLPVAEHSAEALVALNDKDSVPALVQMLDLPMGTQPVRVGSTTQFAVRELVRINHLGNCALCHQPSFDAGDLVRGPIPTPGTPIPGPSTTPAYYSGDRGDFVRADVTYLRQDFSVVQPVPQPNGWPDFQRFDYVVRLRKPTDRELASLTATSPDKAVKNPWRDAALFALKELTGKDLGKTSKDWETGLLELKEPPTRDDLAKSAGRDWRQFVTTMLPDIKAGER